MLDMVAELYFKVFYEAAWGNSLIPLASEATFLTLKSFGGFNMPLAAALAVFGATLGQTFNWILGTLLLSLHHQGMFRVSDYWYNKISYLFNTYLIFMLFFSWAPLCKVMLLIAGFLDTRLRFVLPLVIAGQIFNYVGYLL